MRRGPCLLLSWAALLTIGAPQFWFALDPTYHTAGLMLLPATLLGWPLVALLASAARGRREAVLWALALATDLLMSCVPVSVWIDRDNPSMPGGLVGVLFLALPASYLLSLVVIVVALIVRRSVDDRTSSSASSSAR